MNFYTKKLEKKDHSDEIASIYSESDNWGLSTCIDLRSCNPQLIRDPKAIENFTIELCKLINVKRVGECQLIHYGEKEEIKGYSLVQLIETSLISGHFAEALNNAYLDIFSCRYYDPVKVFEFAANFFQAQLDISSMHYHLRQKLGPAFEMSNDKVEVKDAGIFGRGLFAKRIINEGEAIAIFDGPIYEAEKASNLPNLPPLMVRDTAIQFDHNKWRDSNSLARFANHSCEPNSGIVGLFTLTAMRKILLGEQVTFDYDMVEDSDWTMDCHCSSEHCRKVIYGFRNLPKYKVNEYGKYISNWLI